MYSIFWVSAVVAILFAQVAFSSPLEKRDRGSTLNVFANRVSLVNSEYASRLQQTIDSFNAQGDSTNALRGKTLQRTASTFIWYTSISAQSYFRQGLDEALKKQTSTGEKITVPFVVYNMPDRDCGSTASVGELTFANDGLNKYKGMIDTISSILDQYPTLMFAVIIEPDSLANIVTNIGRGRCTAELSDQYAAAYGYAVSKLQKSNVGLYIDIAHSNWLGWPDTLPKVAQYINKIMTASGTTTKIRGYSTNVSNYCPYTATTPDTGFYGANPNYSETRYIASLKPHLLSLGLPTKFIVDTGRSGRSNIIVPGTWCNANGAGLGARPTANTGNSDVDALVWAKPPGDSDGSSIQGGPGYDVSCTGALNFKPAPAPGVWFTEYSKMLIRNANPPVAPAAT